MTIIVARIMAKTMAIIMAIIMTINMTIITTMIIFHAFVKHYGPRPYADRRRRPLAGPRRSP
jgi:hypothetical protein